MMLGQEPPQKSTSVGNWHKRLLIMRQSLFAISIEWGAWQEPRLRYPPQWPVGFPNDAKKTHLIVPPSWSPQDRDRNRPPCLGRIGLTVDWSSADLAHWISLFLFRIIEKVDWLSIHPLVQMAHVEAPLHGADLSCWWFLSHWCCKLRLSYYQSQLSGLW